jgi:hypothetical protein
LFGSFLWLRHGLRPGVIVDGVKEAPPEDHQRSAGKRVDALTQEGRDGGSLAVNCGAEKK